MGVGGGEDGDGLDAGVVEDPVQAIGEREGEALGEAAAKLRRRVSLGL